MYVAGAQKNNLIDTVLLSTHNKCFDWELRKMTIISALSVKFWVFLPIIS